MNITYRDVIGEPGYCVGDDGSFWSSMRYVQGLGLGRGKRVPTSEWRQLKPSPDEDGHLVVGIRGKTHYLHCLILEAFVGPCPPGMECRHLNGNPADNRLENLAWGTHTENQQDRFAHGTDNRGERNGRAKLTADDVREIRKLSRQGRSIGDLARQFGVVAGTIDHIITGRNWSWLRDE